MLGVQRAACDSHVESIKSMTSAVQTKEMPFKKENRDARFCSALGEQASSRHLWAQVKRLFTGTGRSAWALELWNRRVILENLV